MSLIIVEKSQNRLVALWQITENSLFFENQLLKEDLDYVNSKYSATSFNKNLQEKQNEKKLERLAVRVLIKNLVEQMDFNYTFLEKTNTGKPFLHNNKIIKVSISHDFPFCAAIIDTKNEVGIDIQSLTPKISRVFRRVMSQEEQEKVQTLEKQTLFWSSKEALYKYADIEGLFFKEDLNVKLKTNNRLFGRIKNDLISGEWLPLFNYNFKNEEKEFVVVWL